MRLVFSIFSYKVEIWTRKKAEHSALTPFRCGAGEKYYQYFQTSFGTNESILQELNLQSRLFTLCHRKILDFFHHKKKGITWNNKQLPNLSTVNIRDVRYPTRWSNEVCTAFLMRSTMPRPPQTKQRSACSKPSPRWNHVTTITNEEHDARKRRWRINS